MPGPTVVCTDGSELSLHAIGAGLEILESDRPVILVTAVELADPTLVTGTGMAGGVMTPDDAHELEVARETAGSSLVEQARTTLGLAQAETRVLRGDAGPALCEFAGEVGASALVLGSRGRGGIKRAFLGSVSDFVVRNAPCPVVVTGPHDEGAPATS